MKFLKLLKRLLKSKTIDFNAGFLALVALVGALGYQLSPEIVATASAFMNWVLRAITKMPLSEK
ncbi:MAG: hypothetical protein JRJ85_21710 [Deltaproteobacteria bacterium]|nr:hypothetical protein [Deltaproteobacteria bacterium]